MTWLISESCEHLNALSKLVFLALCYLYIQLRINDFYSVLACLVLDFVMLTAWSFFRSKHTMSCVLLYMSDVKKQTQTKYSLWTGIDCWAASEYWQVSLVRKFCRTVCISEGGGYKHLQLCYQERFTRDTNQHKFT